MNIHFIGIGGIGVSALAKYYLAKGHQVSGSDLVSSEITDGLKEKGVKLFIGKHRAKNIAEDVDLVIYSPAVPKDNPELKSAYLIQHRVLSYPEALGELTRKHFTIAVSGTHGKSTATAMLGLLLVKAGFDPTVIVGTKLREFGNSNCRVGKSKYLVIEADEYMASFLNYLPKIIVLTTIEEDHLDYFKNLKNILKTFREYIGHLPRDGVLVANKDDENIRQITSTVLPCPISSYSIKQNEAIKLKEILKIPGEHNVSNALAALTVARALKIPDKISFKSLSEYRGSWRRFEIKQLKIACPVGSQRLSFGENCKLKIVHDYAHHPTEVRVTLKAAKEKFPRKKIWCVFQPHQYQRTYYLFDDFVKVLSQAPVDRLIITDIYDVAGRENKEIKKKVSSEKLVKVINKIIKKQTWHKRVAVAGNLCRVEYISSIEKTASYLKKNLKGDEVVIIMGAGDIYDLEKLLMRHLKRT